MGVYVNGVDQSLGIKNTDAEMRDAVVSDATKFAGANLTELAAANLPADIDTLLTRLSLARAGYLDELAAANIPADVDTLKTYCDILDDVTNGLAAIKAEVEGLAGAAMRGTDSAALASVCTEVRLAELAAANLPANIDTLLARVTAAVALASVCTEARLAELGSTNIPADTDPKVMGRAQIFQKAITSAANVGDVLLATITTQACLIKSIVLKAVTAVQTDLTSAAISGGAAKVITFINATDAAKANIDAIDEQVAWTGAVELAATKTIVISLAGVGVTAVNLLVTIEFEAVVSGGYLV